MNEKNTVVSNITGGGGEVATIAALAVARRAHVPTDAVVLPPGYHLEDVERMSAARRNLRGTFECATVADFVHYFAQNVEANALHHAPVFIDPRSGCAVCCFDWKINDDLPGHQEHAALLRLEVTPEWAALMTAHMGNGMDQDAMVEFLTDWADDVSAYDDSGQMLGPAELVRVFRHVQVIRKSEAGQILTDTSVERSAMESVEARNRTTTPATLTFHLKPFEGFTSRPVLARVVIRPTNANAPSFRLRIVRLASIQQDIAREFKETLVDAILGEFPDAPPAIYLGRFNGGRAY